QSPATLVFLGDFLSRFDLLAAVKLLGNAQQRYPADLWINHQLAFLLMNMKPPQAEKAVGYYRAAMVNRPGSGTIHCNLGWALECKGQFDEAITECREAIRLSRDDATAHNNLGVALGGKGEFDAAIAEFREAIRLKPDYAFARMNLGSSLVRK